MAHVKADKGRGHDQTGHRKSLIIFIIITASYHQGNKGFEEDWLA